MKQILRDTSANVRTCISFVGDGCESSQMTGYVSEDVDEVHGLLRPGGLNPKQEK